MDPDKFSSELQTWMQESGAVKELKTRLRKEMYDLLLTKKLPRDAKNINIKNDKTTCKPVTDFDLALNLLIVEHLMQKGLWYTASVMVSEAEFIEDPPEIEVVTTAKKSPNSDKLTEYKRQSPAKLSDETVAKISNCIFDFDDETFCESVLLSYYRQKDASVMSLMFKHINIEKVVPEPSKSETPEVHENNLEKADKRTKRREKKHKESRTSTSISTEDFTSEEVRMKRAKKEKKRKEETLNDERDEALKKLQKQLLDARCEIESLAESKVRMAHFQSVIESQNFCLDELRKEVKCLKSQHNLLSDKLIETKKTDKNLNDNLLTFVEQIKTSVDELGIASQTIDNEFAAI